MYQLSQLLHTYVMQTINTNKQATLESFSSTITYTVHNYDDDGTSHNTKLICAQTSLPAHLILRMPLKAHNSLCE